MQHSGACLSILPTVQRSLSGTAPMVSEQSSLFSNISHSSGGSSSMRDVLNHTSSNNHPLQHILAPGRFVNNSNISGCVPNSDCSKSYREAPKCTDFVNANNAVGNTAALRASISKRSTSAPPRIDRNRESADMCIGTPVDDRTTKASKWASTPLSNYMLKKAGLEPRSHVAEKRHHFVQSNPIIHVTNEFYNNQTNAASGRYRDFGADTTVQNEMSVARSRVISQQGAGGTQPYYTLRRQNINNQPTLVNNQRNGNTVKDLLNAQ